MTKLGEGYKCEICRNIVEILHGGVETLACCDKEMQRLEEKPGDSTVEKHVPYIEKNDHRVFLLKMGRTRNNQWKRNIILNGYRLPPMALHTRVFTASGKPQAAFDSEHIQAEKIEAREYCNLHGLWKS